LQAVSLKNQPDHESLDLVEMRRQLPALRSQHSDNLRIASLLNRFLVKIVFRPGVSAMIGVGVPSSEFNEINGLKGSRGR
jgi:hypothetical protein